MCGNDTTALVILFSALAKLPYDYGGSGRGHGRQDLRQPANL
jgi:hypothetical protein